MKRIFIVGLAGIMFLAACENTGSSTVGTYEKDETTQSSEKTEGEAAEGQVKEKTETNTKETNTTTMGTDSTTKESIVDSSATGATPKP